MTNEQSTQKLTFDDYQQSIEKFCVYPGNNISLAYEGTLPSGLSYVTEGLFGELGEVMEKVKKIRRDKSGVVSSQDIEEITKELGDVIFYLARYCYHLDISFSDVAQTNINKLESRLARNKINGNGDNR
jgi:NTP pyrophosphatase (non-canonical NTP hydrolase)